MTIGEIDPRYGDPSVAAPAWDAIEDLLTDAQLYWIITVRADGRPHAVPLVGVGTTAHSRSVPALRSRSSVTSTPTPTWR
jgi:hypothetical protein